MALVCGSTSVTQKFAPHVVLSGSAEESNVPEGRGLRIGSPLTFTCGTIGGSEAPFILVGLELLAPGSGSDGEGNAGAES